VERLGQRRGRLLGISGPAGVGRPHPRFVIANLVATQFDWVDNLWGAQGQFNETTVALIEALC
jgi:hypothetical protein